MPADTAFDDVLIVGSGPSGIAAAHVLARRGVRPVVVDGGIVPNDEAFGRQAAARSDAAPVSKAAERSPDRSSTGEKSWFGSRAPYEQPIDGRVRYADGLAARISHGVGGFSLVWGATFAFYDTFDDWPADSRPTEEDRALVEALVPTATTDFADGHSGRQVPGSVHSADLFVRLRATTPDQWRVRPSRVAIDVEPSSATRCHPCGGCLTGCAFESIWSSRQVLDRSAAAGAIDHRPGIVVVRTVERDDHVEVHGTSTRGTPVVMRARRVLLGAGAIGTPAIIVRSRVTEKLVVHDSQTLFGGSIDHRVRRRTADADVRRHHGLSQFWIESTERDPLDRMSVQLYPPSVEHVERVHALVPFVPHQADWAIAAGLRRLHPFVAYVSSRHSGAMIVSAHGRDEIAVAALHSADNAHIRRRLRSLRHRMAHVGLMLPVAGVRAASPGEGYHSGASMPHGRTSDLLGRPFGLARTHVIDSSVFPSIQSGSITPTIMANAARIARQLPMDDR